MRNDSTLQAIERLFHEVSTVPETERAAVLDEADVAPEVRMRVAAMLLQLDRDDTLERPAEAVTRAARDEGPGAVIDRYKLLQVIGEGGFGVVYMAEQLEPVRRKVALKVIKLGMDTREVVARFEAERQALALMDHPNIAKVLDGGQTPSGRPYFVMELVRGVPITTYCDRNQLGNRERLALFVKVCRAVQHAHQKGIIHRDLKPSNVLVTLHDTAPVPMVIDFGVAKAMHTRLTERTLFTAYHRFIGTPAYMSPEQAEMSALDVDTRTDIYALGVLLYELLTGTTPFDAERLLRAGLVEIQRVLREEQPPRPSLRISTGGDAAVAAHRRLDVAGLSRQLRGDLDWIVMKALEKERVRRYATANELAEDVRRHLADEPVAAGPPGAGYRLRKLLTRHRAAAASAALVVLTLVAGTVGTVAGLRAAERQRDAAQAEAARAVAATDFLRNTLALTDPAVVLTPDLSVRALLDRAAERAPVLLGDQPRAEATIRGTIGRAYASLGENALAEAHLRRSVALSEAHGTDDEADFYDVLWTLTHVLFRLERPDNRTIANRARRAGHDVVGREHPALRDALDRFIQAVDNAAHSMDPTAIEPAHGPFAEATALARDRLPAGDPLWLILADGLTAAGYNLWYTAHEGTSEAYWREALAIRRRELPPAHPDIAEAHGQLAIVLNRAGKSAEAEATMREAVAHMRTVHRPGTFQLAVAESTLGETLIAQGRFAEAEPLLLDGYRTVLATVEAPWNFFALDALSRLIRLYEAWERPQDGAPYRRRLAELGATGPWLMPWALARQAFGPENGDLLAALDQVDSATGGLTYTVSPGSAGPGDDFTGTLDAVESARARLGSNDPLASHTARLLVGWAEGLSPDSDPRPRERMATLAVRDLRGGGDAIVPELAEALAQLAVVYAQRGDTSRARAVGTEAWQLVRGGGGDDLWTVAIVKARIGRSLAAAGLRAEAASLLPPVVDMLTRYFGPGHVDTQTIHDLLDTLGDPSPEVSSP